MFSQVFGKLLIATILLFSMSASATEPTAIATKLLDRLDASQFDLAVSDFGAEMKTAVPADRLKQVWQSLPAQFGPAAGRGDAAVSKQESVTLVQIPLHYAHGDLVAKIAIGADDKVIGFLIQPAPPSPAPPPSADANYREIDFADWHARGVRYILDGRNTWARRVVEAQGITYVGIGR